MRFVHRFVAVALVGAVGSWLPLAASAAWDFERSGPHRVDTQVEIAATPQEARSLAPKQVVAMERPVAAREGEPPVGSRSLATKPGVAFSRPIAPESQGAPSELPLASD